MTTRDDFAGFSRALEGRMVLSVYIARENEDPGMGSAWMKRLEVALGDLRADLEVTAPTDVPAFERAVEWVLSGVESFGRILPHEGWCAFATEDRLWLAEGLAFQPPEMVRWRLGAAVAPYVRALKEERPVVLAVLSGLHANVYRYEHGGLSAPMELHAEWPSAEAGDVGISKRASRSSGVRGATKSDYTKRTQDENVRRHHKQLEDVLREMAGEGDVVMLGGTQKAIHAVRKDLEEIFRGRLAELPEVTYDSPREELIGHLRVAASRLNEERQAGVERDLPCAGGGCRRQAPRLARHGRADTRRRRAAGATRAGTGRRGRGGRR
jgi:hypothetical protein